MIKDGFSTSFRRAYRKHIRNRTDKEKKFSESLSLFMNDPFHPRLRTHKLTGQLKDLWSFSIEYDLRVVFYFVTDSEVVFEDIGTHDEVY